MPEIYVNRGGRIRTGDPLLPKQVLGNPNYDNLPYFPR